MQRLCLIKQSNGAQGYDFDQIEAKLDARDKEVGGSQNPNNQIHHKTNTKL